MIPLYFLCNGVQNTWFQRLFLVFSKRLSPMTPEMELRRAFTINKKPTERFPLKWSWDRRTSMKSVAISHNFGQNLVILSWFLQSHPPFSKRLSPMTPEMELRRACNTNKKLTERFPLELSWGRRTSMTTDPGWCQIPVIVSRFLQSYPPFSKRLSPMTPEMELRRAYNTNKKLTERFPLEWSWDRRTPVKLMQGWCQIPVIVSCFLVTFGQILLNFRWQYLRHIQSYELPFEPWNLWGCTVHFWANLFLWEYSEWQVSSLSGAHAFRIRSQPGTRADRFTPFDTVNHCSYLL